MGNPRRGIVHGMPGAEHLLCFIKHHSCVAVVLTFACFDPKVVSAGRAKNQRCWRLGQIVGSCMMIAPARATDEPAHLPFLQDYVAHWVPVRGLMLLAAWVPGWGLASYLGWHLGVPLCWLTGPGARAGYLLLGCLCSVWWCCYLGANGTALVLLATWLPVGAAGYLGARAGWCRAWLLASWIAFLGLVLVLMAGWGGGWCCWLLGCPQGWCCCLATSCAGFGEVAG